LTPRFQRLAIRPDPLIVFPSETVILRRFQSVLARHRQMAGKCIRQHCSLHPFLRTGSINKMVIDIDRRKPLLSSSDCDRPAISSDI